MSQLILTNAEAAKIAIPKMIDAGVEVLIAAQKAEAAKLTSSGRSTGALVKSIKADKLKEVAAGAYREVYPHGTDDKGVKNAEKGFYLEYGRSNMAARPWITNARNAAADKIAEAQREVWNDVTNNSS
jgi:hypothetical protein